MMVTAFTKHLMTAGLISLLFLSSAAISQASLYDRPKERVPLPSPIGYVSDHAQVVEGEWKDRIRSVCTDLEKKSGVEMAIVTVPSTRPPKPVRCWDH